MDIEDIIYLLFIIGLVVVFIGVIVLLFTLYMAVIVLSIGAGIMLLALIIDFVDKL